VLQSPADLFRTFFRSTICCRQSSEEFAIILLSHLRKTRTSC